VLADRAATRRLASVLDPVIRAVDWAVGEKVAMLVELEYDSELRRAGRCIWLAR
jgi:hypothetical protein